MLDTVLKIVVPLIITGLSGLLSYLSIQKQDSGGWGFVQRELSFPEAAKRLLDALTKNVQISRRSQSLGGRERTRGPIRTKGPEVPERTPGPED